MKWNRWIFVLAALGAMASGLWPAQGAATATAQTPAFLEGKVFDLAKDGLSLDRRMELARPEAEKAGNRNGFFTAYLFQSRHKVRYGDRVRTDERYVVSSQPSRIKIVEKGREKLDVSQSSDDKEGSWPAVLLVLHGAKPGEIAAASVLDPERVYEFSETPVYWLGEARTDESLAFVERTFEAAKESHLQETLLFLVSCHPGTAPYDFLKKAALGTCAKNVRSNAIFWLGTYGDSRSLGDLKEIFGKVGERSLKEQVVFALQLSQQKEATVEIIRIAKDDPDREVRSKAVFWLGQKASAESVKALKDIVGGQDEADSLKDQAVFAISQLPKDKSVPMLIDIAKTNKSASVRKKAIFWLGQTGDEAALKFFEEILLKK
jgi:hypothetical protein